MSQGTRSVLLCLVNGASRGGGGGKEAEDEAKKSRQRLLQLGSEFRLSGND